MARKLVLIIAFLFWSTSRALAVPATCAITGNVVTISGAPAAVTPVFFTTGSLQSTGGSVIAAGQRTMVFTDSSGNLPTTGGCLPSGSQFCPPQGAYFQVQIGNGPTSSALQVPLMSTVDLNQLIIENKDPVSVVTDVQSANGSCTVVNPGTGQAGTATLTCSGSSGGIANYTGPISITGTSTTGTDRIGPVCINGVCDLKDFGAACDGVTDDSAALGSALTASAHGALFIDPSANGCLLNSTVVYSVASLGGIHIYGASATNGSGSSTLDCNAVGGCLELTGTPGSTGNHDYPVMDHIHFTVPSTAAGDVTYAVSWFGLSGVQAEDLFAYSTGTPKFTTAFDLVATQKSSFKDLYSNGNGTGMATADNSGVSSNQNNVIHFQSLGDKAWCVDIEGGASANVFSSLSCQNNVNSSDGGFLNNQTTGAGGFLANLIVHDSEFEADSGILLDVAQGGVTVSDSYFVSDNSSGNPSIYVAAKGWVLVTGSVDNLGITLATTNTSGHFSVFENNIINHAASDSSGLGTIWFNNLGGPLNTVITGSGSFASAPTCDTAHNGEHWVFSGGVTTCTFNMAITGGGSIGCPAVCAGGTWIAG